MIKVRLFAMLREIAGTEVLEVPLPEGKRVRNLIDDLSARHPDLALPFRQRRVLVAVNRNYASMETALTDGAEVALFPPVSGG